LSNIKEPIPGVYNQIKEEIALFPVELPPSAAIAGVYAKVDRERGVWKAPANVSLNYVIKPSVQITNEEQKDMNVDTTAGKSVNAIRSFTGQRHIGLGRTDTCGKRQ